MKNKKEICVHIRNEKELKQAREILERNGEKIDEELFYVGECLDFNYLKLGDECWELFGNIIKPKSPYPNSNRFCVGNPKVLQNQYRLEK